MLAGDELEHNFKTIECEPETSSIRHTVSTGRAEASVCVQTAPGDGEAMALDVTDAAAEDDEDERASGPSPAGRNCELELGRPSRRPAPSQCFLYSKRRRLPEFAVLGTPESN